MQIEEISSLPSKIKDAKAEIKSILDPCTTKDGRRLDFNILNSIEKDKGVGIDAIAAVGDVSCFPNSDKLISFIGFYPKIFESEKYKEKTHQL